MRARGIGGWLPTRIGGMAVVVASGVLAMSPPGRVAAGEGGAPRDRDAAAIALGAELFQREWSPGDERSPGGDGLGPVYNDTSCVACHNLGATGGGGPANKNILILNGSPLIRMSPGVDGDRHRRHDDSHRGGRRFPAVPTPPASETPDSPRGCSPSSTGRMRGAANAAESGAPRRQARTRRPPPPGRSRRAPPPPRPRLHRQALDRRAGEGPSGVLDVVERRLAPLRDGPRIRPVATRLMGMGRIDPDELRGQLGVAHRAMQMSEMLQLQTESRSLTGIATVGACRRRGGDDHRAEHHGPVRRRG